MRKKLKTWPVCSVVSCASFILKFSRTLPKRQQKQLKKKKRKEKRKARIYENSGSEMLHFFFFCFVYYSSTFTLERDNLYCCAQIFTLFKCTWTQWKIWVYLMDWSNAQYLNVSHLKKFCFIFHVNDLLLLDSFLV